MNFINQLLGNLRKVYYSFKDNIWGVDIVNMQLISKNKKGIGFFFFCAIGLFSNYAFVVPLKYKKGTLLLMHFKVF